MSHHCRKKIICHSRAVKFLFFTTVYSNNVNLRKHAKTILQVQITEGPLLTDPKPTAKHTKPEPQKPIIVSDDGLHDASDTNDNKMNKPNVTVRTQFRQKISSRGLEIMTAFTKESLKKTLSDPGDRSRRRNLDQNELPTRPSVTSPNSPRNSYSTSPLNQR